MWNIIECQAKLYRFSYTNWHIQRIFWYLVRLFEWKLSRNWKFQNSELILKAKFHLIFLKTIFSSESWRTAFIKNICNLKYLKTGFSQQKCAHILMVLLRKSCKLSKHPLNMLIGISTLLNFTWYTKELHNCNTNVHTGPKTVKL